MITKAWGRKLDTLMFVLLGATFWNLGSKYVQDDDGIEYNTIMVSDMEVGQSPTIIQNIQNIEELPPEFSVTVYRTQPIAPICSGLGRTETVTSTLSLFEFINTPCLLPSGQYFATAKWIKDSGKGVLYTTNVFQMVDR